MVKMRTPAVWTAGKHRGLFVLLLIRTNWQLRSLRKPRCVICLARCVLCLACPKIEPNQERVNYELASTIFQNFNVWTAW